MTFLRQPYDNYLSIYFWSIAIVQIRGSSCALKPFPRRKRRTSTPLWLSFSLKGKKAMCNFLRHN